MIVNMAARRIVFAAFWLLLSFWGRPAIGADAVGMNWAQFQIDPEPTSRPTLREKMEAHLNRVDRSLSILRLFCREPERGWPTQRLTSSECSERIQAAWKCFSELPNDPANAKYVGSVDELVHCLVRVKDIAGSVEQGKQIEPQSAQTLQADHGLIKMIRRQLRAFAATAAEKDVPTRVSNVTGRGAALIVYPTADAPPSQAHLPYPIGAVLWKMSTLDTTQRAEFMRHVINDHESQVLEIASEPGCNPKRPSFFILVAKQVELPSGEFMTVELPFRSTTEVEGVEGWRNALRILTNTSTQARVTVRNTLLTEVPLTTELSITACETVVSFAPALDAEHHGQSVVCFGAEVELTFYRHLSSRLRDVSFRSIAVSKSNASTQRAKDRGARRSSDELAQMITLAAESSPVRPQFGEIGR
jgi:hypothetical protein